MKNIRPLIKRHRRGRVGNDGNGMVGGRWENTTRLAYKDIPVERLTECIFDADKAEICLSWFKEKVGESFRVEAYFDCGYDHSVGLGEYCEMHEGFDPEQSVFDAIESSPVSDEEICRMLVELANICEDEDGYEFYEID